MKNLCFIFAALLLIACKEAKEEPIHFETTAPLSYRFLETEDSATFTVSGNTAWVIEVTEGSDRCSVTPASGKGDATVTVRVMANPFYLQSDMTLVLTAGNYTKQIPIIQAAPPCPDFNPGAIATDGQTVTIGGTPATINSAHAATGGDGQITYQWYINGDFIDDATAADYTPPRSDVEVAGVYIYTRRAKDNVCNPTFTPSAGSWVLRVTCPSFSPGTIATAGQTITVGDTPIMINSVQNATSENGAISYQWYKNGNVISYATAANYTPPRSDATTAGAITYTRRAKDNVCNTTFTPSAGSWVLTVSCPSFSPGTIATTGQTIFVGETPAAIESITDATSENGNISYQWYKDEDVIYYYYTTAAYYTPPPSDAEVAGVHTYTRRAKDDVCNTTFTPSVGSWVLTVTCPSFNPGAIATNGQTIFVGETPTMISSVQNATSDGTISYQWYKNGIAITGATSAYYTPPSADAIVVGAHTYTRRAKDNTCNTTLTVSEGIWVLTVVCPDFNPGTIVTGEQTICSGNSVNTITSSANASSGNGSIIYEWRRNGMALASTNANYYNPSAYNTTSGTHTFTRWAKDSYCSADWTQSNGQWQLIVNGTPTITLISGNTNQTKKKGEAIDIIKYTTANATSAYKSSGELPLGVTGSWNANTYTISGTIAASADVQTYNYTVATTNSNGCLNDTKTGKINVKVGVVPSTGGPNTAYSTTTWVIDKLTWSDRIVASPSSCTRTDDWPTVNYPANFRVYNDHYIYSWSCIILSKTDLCPEGWRVPYRADVESLESSLKSLPDLMDIRRDLLNAWRPSVTLSSYSNDIYVSDDFASLWTQTAENGTYAYILSLGAASGPSLSRHDQRDGIETRCVKQW